MFENPWKGKQARNFTTNVPKILDLKSSSEHIFSENYRWVPLNCYVSNKRKPCFVFHCYVSDKRKPRFVFDCHVSDKRKLCFVFDCYVSDKRKLCFVFA